MGNQQKKTIEFKGYYFRLILITFIISYLIIFATQHFGDFRYRYYQKETQGEAVPGMEGANYVYYDWNRDDPVLSITFETILGSKITFPSDGWKIRDMDNSLGGFHKYNNKFKYYNRATVEEFKYVLLIWILLVLTVLFSKKFKIKIT